MLYKTRWLVFLFLCILTASSCGSSKTASHTSDKHKHAKQQRLSKQQRKKYAALLHTSTDNITHHKLYLFIDEWWGVKYQYGGNTRQGIDCSGLTHLLYQEVYDRNIFRSSLQLFENSKLIKQVKHLREGDLVFFATNEKDRQKVSHVGVYLMNHYFVHVSTQKGVTINNLEERYWKDHWVCGGRVRD